MADLDGRPMVSYPLAALDGAGLNPVVVAKENTSLPELDAEILLEPDVPRHPLAGIVAALRALRAPILVCGCDLPFVTSPLARHVADFPGLLVVPRAEGRLQPLFARYEPELLAPLEEALERSAALTTTVERLAPTVLRESELRRFGDPARLFANVNTPAELDAASADALGERP